MNQRRFIQVKGHTYQCNNDNLEKHHSLSPMITSEKDDYEERVGSSNEDTGEEW